MTSRTAPRRRRELPPIAVGYVRVSTKEQAQFGHSLQTQKIALQAFAHAEGYELSRIFEDEGESAWQGDCPEFLELLKWCRTQRKDRPVTHLVILQLDRFARNLRY